MPLQKLQFNPGINKEITNYSNEQGWYAGDKIRFKKGFPEQIGGWTRVSDTQVIGTPRTLINWIALNGDNLVGVGTNIKYYVLDGQTFVDKTPAIETVSTLGTDPFTTTSGSTTVTVTDTTPHNAVDGTYVTIQGATDTNGIPAAELNKEHRLTYVSSTTYTIEVDTAATSPGSGGGSSVEAEYQISPGAEVFSFTAGWSSGTWPTSTTVALTNPFDTTATNSTITVNHTGHGLSTGDYVRFTSIGTPFAISGDGRTAIDCDEVMLKAFQITKVNNDSYTISLVIGGKTYTADSTATGVGGAVSLTTIGTTTSVWGTTGVADLEDQIRLWVHDNYGEDVITNLYQGDIYYLDKNGSATFKGSAPYTSSSDITYRMRSIKGIVDATPSSPSKPDSSYIPTKVTYSLVSDQARHVICFGADNQGGSGAVSPVGDFDPLLVRWSNSEDYQEWQPKATNSAGDFRLEQGSQIISAVKTRQEILIFTDTAVYTMQYVGLPYVFTFNLLANHISLISPNAVSVANNIVFWMGKDKFYVYDGQVRALPSTLRTFVYNNINTEQEFQVISGTNEAFNEIWWFYPTGTDSQMNNYVIYNYLENIWYYGSLSRSAWLDSGLRPSPIAFDYNRRALNHEIGVDDASGTSSVAINSYIESADFDIGDGHQFSYVWRMIPDLTFTGSTSIDPDVTLTLTPRNYTGGSYTSETGKTVQASALSPQELYTNQVDIRVRGRQLKFKIDGSTAIGTKWQLGTPRIDIKPDGRR